MNLIYDSFTLTKTENCTKTMLIVSVNMNEALLVFACEGLRPIHTVRTRTSKWKKYSIQKCIKIHGSFTLLEMELGTDSESDSCPIQKQGVGILVWDCAMWTCSALYNIAIGYGIWIRIRLRQCKWAIIQLLLNERRFFYLIVYRCHMCISSVRNTLKQKRTEHHYCVLLLADVFFTF